MNNTNMILQRILHVYSNSNIKYFPLDCFELFHAYKYKIYSYQEINEQNPVLLSFCGGYSSDAFIEGNTKIVAYNEKKPESRVRFSLMHEFGHLMLHHKGENSRNEFEANYFASNILAPRMAIHYAKCKNHLDVSRLFNISLQAAEIAFNDYRRWRRIAAYKLSAIDRQMYDHFYNMKEKKFVCFPKKCSCGRTIINPQHNTCSLCQHIVPMNKPLPPESELDKAFLKAEEIWLYGDLY